jgi:hypothetical protein
LNLARKEIEFLGVVWTKGKISIPEVKTLVFKNLPSPTTPKQAKSVICALSHYRKFILHFAKLAHSLFKTSGQSIKNFGGKLFHDGCSRVY